MDYRSLVRRVLMVTWVVLCLSLLAFAYIQKDIHDMPEAFILLLVSLTFPIGIIGSFLTAAIWTNITSIFGYEYQPFRDVCIYWAVVVPLGYWQWFIFLPKKLERSSSEEKDA